MRFESIGQYHDYWSTIVLYAPDAFTTLEGQPVPDPAAALDEAFATVRAGFGFVERKIKDPRLLGVLRELIELSHEAYRAGDAKRGAHAFQECEGLIWPSRGGRLKYAPEAERRRFGDVQLFADVVVSPYPREGTTADLGPHQAALLRHAQAASQRFVDADEPFAALTWVLHADGSVHEVRAPSRAKIAARLREAVAAGGAVACATAHFPFGGTSGLLAIHLEEAGRPQARVIALVEGGVVQAPRVHLHDPEVFGGR